VRVGQARKRDANEAHIREALHAIGVLTFQHSAKGEPDLITWSRREGWGVLEVKMPGAKLTPEQQKTYALAPFPIAESVADALALFHVKC
jgi:hypothetical protein